MIGMRKVKASRLAPDQYVFEVVIGVSEGCKTVEDVQRIMEERDIEGSIFPMSIHPPIKNPAAK